MSGSNGLPVAQGTICKMTPAGVLTSLVSFTGTTGAAIGANPVGALAQGGDGNFYGTASSGGNGGSTFGTIFKVTPAGVFTSLANFTGTSGLLPGTTPTGGLFLGADSHLYGVTAAGGINNLGTIFRVASDGTVASLYAFSGGAGADGTAPNNGLALASDGTFHGGDNLGLFHFTPPPVPLTAPATSLAAGAATINGSITGENSSGQVYFQYGLTTGYGASTSPQSFTSGYTNVPVSATISGLQPLDIYHYRLVAVDGLGNVYTGPDNVFSTPVAIAFSTASTVPITAASYSASGQSLAFSLGFAPATGTVLTLVNNTGFSPVFGTFNGLPEGATISVTFGGQPYLFQISYVGGDGNDITLTAVSQAITFPAIPSQLATNAPFALTATATSALPVSYSVLAGSGVASVSGSTVTLSGATGTVTIQATQAGNGTYGPALPVVRTFAVNAAGSPFVQISGSKSSDVFLGIRANGTLWGWGYGSNSQIGNSSSTSQSVPVQVGGTTNWKSVSVGGSHTVAVRTDGTLWAWGSNVYGQVGDGTTTTRSSPVQVGAGTTWALAVAGSNHTVAVKTDGTLWSWGYNGSGQLGQGTTDGNTHSTPVQVGVLTTWRFTGQSLSAGGDFTLALSSNGTLWAWGVNVNGQLGNGTTINATAPVQIGAATNWSSVAGGSSFSTGLRADGTLWAWGLNSSGQLGDGTLGQNINPTQVGTATNWQSLAAGSAFAMAIKADGTLWTWGANTYGQLGQGFYDAVTRGNVPTQVGTGTNWQLVAPSANASLAVKSDGTPWSWGYNLYGELGYNERLPLPVAAQLGPVSMASGGNGHSVALKPDGSLWAWGLNGNGQLGQGSSDNGPHVAPAQILPGTLWSSVATGGMHTMGVKNDGTLWGWGYNFDGELGDGTIAGGRNSPVQIGTASNWLTVAAGYFYTLALKSDGTLWAWGQNLYGQVGNGNTTSQLTPVQVGTDTDWAAISAGYFHSVALKRGGTLWAWGLNNNGQLGDGTGIQRLTPVQVGGSRNWKSVSAGWYHTVAMQSDGSLWAWGQNANGQLGDGTQTSRLSPVQIGTDTSWTAVAAGAYHTLGAKAAGTLWSWGLDASNQLGDGGTSNRLSPAQVGASTAWQTPFKSMYQSLVTTNDGTLWGFGLASNGATGYAWRNQLVPDLVLPALSTAQTVTFPTIGNVSVGNTVTLAAASSSGLPASYVVSGPAQLNGSQLTATGAGTISVIAYQAGDSYWQSSDIAQQYVNPTPPSVSTDHVDTITTTSATVYGYVNPNGLQTTAQFLSGLTNSYGQTTSVALAPASGASAQYVSATITGLSPGTAYHFAMSATNAGGTTTGGDLTFATLAPVITVFDGTLTGTVLSDGGSPVNFGTFTIPQSTTRTFTIQNAGTATLTLNPPFTVGGANATEFTVDTSATTTSLAPGNSTTFNVTFAPAGSGSRTAGLQIASNSLGTLSPFDINLGGTGLLPETITFGTIAQQSCGTPLALTASSSSSLPVSFAITQGGGIASLSGGNVSFSAPGTVTIQATQAGNATYASAAPVSQTFTVVPGTQTITFDSGVPTLVSYSSPVTLVASSNFGLTPVTFVVLSGPGGVAGGTLTFSGPGQVVVQAAQAGSTAFNPAAAQMVITAFNTPPVSSNGSAAGDENTTITGAATATDAQGTALNFILVTSPSHGTLTLNSNGSFSYVPAQYFHGTDSFTFKANDGYVDSNVSTVTLTVRHVNQAPVAAGGSAIGDESTTLTGTVTATDVDGDALTYAQVAGAAHGTVTVNSNGSFSYVPTQYFHGTDSFTFKANDGQLDSAAATVTLTVRHVNQAPVSANGGVTGNENTTLTGTVTATDVDGDPLTYATVAGPAHGTLTLNSTGSFSYTPAQYYHGADTFTFKANDGQLDSNVSTVTLTVNHVNQAPVSTNGIAAGNENTTITGAATATDVDADPLTYAKVASPAHGTLTLGSNGSFSYVPTTYYYGADSFTFKANDGQLDSNVATITVTVNHVNQAPVSTNGTASGNENTTLTGTVTATDVDGDPLTYATVAGPAHGTVTLNSNGSFSYVPAQYYHGTDTFTFKANDGQLDSNVSTVNLTVSHVNQAPVSANGAATGNENATLTGTVTATDVDGDALTYAQVVGAAHGTVTLNSNGSFSYVPAQYYHGIDSFTFKANDGQLDSNVSTVTLTVNHVNQAPVSTNGAANGNENTTLTGTVSATDVDGDALTYLQVTGSAHGTLTLNANGSFSFVPVQYYHGTDSFTFKSNDGQLDSNVSTVTLTVNHVNQAPVVSDAAVVGNENVTITGTVPSSDVDGDTLTFAQVTGPAHGTLTLNSNGTYSYVPAQYYHGTDSFTFKANDGQLDSNVATVTITVQHTNQAPVVSNASVTGNENTTITGTVTATDVDGNSLTYAQVTGTAHGALTFNSNGSFSYVPVQYYHGTDSFTFKANDGLVDSNVATLTLTVNHVNQAPVSANGAAGGNENTTLTGSVTATDVDGDPLTYAQVVGPAHGTLNLSASGSFSYVPAQYYHGTDAFTFKANDGQLDSNVSTITLTVAHVNQAPVSANGAVTGNENTTLAGTVTATDVDADPLTYAQVTGTAHGTLTLNASGSFSYVPAQYFHGTDAFTFKANDGQLDSNVSTITLTVSHVNQAPVSVNGSVTGDENTTLTGTVTATDVDGDPLTYAQAGSPAHGTLTLNNDGSFSYVPAQYYHGTDNFTFKANDGQMDSNVATVALTVNHVNQAPVAADGTATGNENTTIAGTLGVTDVDADPLTYSVVTGPVKGSLTLHADGSFSYVPSQYFHGTDSFTFKANDGQLDSNVAVVTITVGHVNHAPVSANGSASGSEDTTFTGAATATDVDGDALTYAQVTGPAHGTLTLNGDGTFSYVPAQYYHGGDSFTFKANDGQADSNVATITLTVAHVNQAPVVQAASATGLQGNLIRGTVTGTDVDGDALSYAQAAAPAHGTLTLNADGTFSYLPDPAFVGTDTFTYKANDGSLDSNVATVTIVIITSVPQWTWMDGPSTANQKGVYGTLGTAAAANTPGARQDAATWSDGLGHFWMFGGTGYGASAGPGALSDLWAYDAGTGTWTWLGGGSAINAGGTYGVQGTPAAANTPGARVGAATWTDHNGNLWLFGGNGRDGSTSGTGYLNDLWTYGAGSWAWVGGSNTKAAAVATSTTAPEARSGAATWVDAAGRLMLFGGFALPATGSTPRLLNDLWRYDINANAWTLLRTGSAGQGTYGVLGTGNASTQPGGRANAVSWADTQGRMWLFGGSGFATTTTSGNLNDLWCYDPSSNRWTWMSGASTISAAGVYGTLGVTDPASHPGARSGATGWTDAAGAFWLFGGTGNSASSTGLLSDVWCYQPVANTWTWMKGPGTPGIPGAYGTSGVADSANTPGARQCSMAFPDANGNLWLFGGVSGTSYYGDVWRLTLPPEPVVQRVSFLALPPYAQGHGPYFIFGVSVNANGLPTTAHVRYSTHPDMSDAVDTADQQVGAGTSAVLVQGGSNVLPATNAIYYVQAVAVNSFGQGIGSVTSFPFVDSQLVAPVASFASPGSTVSEAAGTVSVAVQLSAPSTTAFTIPFTLGGTATPGADYTAPALTLSFVPGQTIATVDLPIRDDTVHEATETIVITLGTPTGGVALGNASVYTLSIQDNDFAPQFSNSPDSVFATVGTSTTMSAAVTGSGPLSYQWLKNGTAITGATSASYTIASTALTSIGNYSLQVSNPTGGAISSPAELDVIDTSAHSFVLVPNATATMTVSASSPGTLSYQWLMNGVPIADAPPHVTGSSTKTLVITQVTAADAAEYTCEVTSDNSGLTAVSGNNELAVVSVKPVVLPVGAMTIGVVGGQYAYQIPVDSAPTKTPASFTVTGLPAGLTVNASGLISGRPTVAVTNLPITITAVNNVGPSAAVTGTLTILPLPATVPGTFAAGVERQPGVAGNLGARVDITPTSAGSYTAKLTLNGLTVNSTGLLATTLDTSSPTPVITAITGHVLFPRTGLSTLVLDFNLNAPPNALVGTLSDSLTNAAAAVTGFRNPWNATAPKAASYQGYYTFGLDIDAGSIGDLSIPQGNGFGSFTVAADGTLTFAGRTADNIAFTTATFAGPAGQVVVFVPSATNLGSLTGIPVIVPDAANNHLSGTLSWNKGPASATSTDHAYAAGFAPLDLAVIGGKYVAPAAGGVLMGLPNSNLNARLSFYEGGLMTGQAPPVIFSIRNNSTTGTAQTVTLPTAGGTANPAKVSFALATSPLGQFSGSLTIANVTPALVRSVTYQGMIISLGSTYQAVGCFLLPQLPQPGQTLTTSPQLSGQVVLDGSPSLTVHRP